MRWTFALPVFAACLAACSPSDPVVIEPYTPTRVLDAEERFQIGYVGEWSESGGCAQDETVWAITGGEVRAGDRSCAIRGLADSAGHLTAELADCMAMGERVGDRVIELDLAGDDVLYLTTSDGRRLRLERCPVDP